MINIYSLKKYSKIYINFSLFELNVAIKNSLTLLLNKDNFSIFLMVTQAVP